MCKPVIYRALASQSAAPSEKRELRENIVDSSKDEKKQKKEKKGEEGARQQ